VNLYKELVKKSDVVLEGFAGGVMERIGLGYEVLKECNPGIIVVSAPGFGAGGPWTDYRCFGTIVWHMSGMSMLSGYPGEGPMQASNTYPDPTAGCHMAGCIIAALLHRRRTGKGQFLDVAQVEPGICFTGPYLLDYIMNGREPERMGNRHPSYAPHGCYPCQGEDNWVTIAVTSDREWEAFCNAIGRPELAKDEMFSDSLSRWQNQEELDRIIMEWTIPRDQYEVMYILQRVGVAAAPVLRVEQVHDNPQLKARGYYEMVTHPEVGTHLYRNVGYRMSETPGHILRHPPCLGEHNEYVLGTILGMSQEEIAELEREQIIGTVPLPGADGQPVGD
jgi:benzylsuccinate CoA-transferase BbsF subunit